MVVSVHTSKPTRGPYRTTALAAALILTFEAFRGKCTEPDIQATHTKCDLIYGCHFKPQICSNLFQQQKK